MKFLKFLKAKKGKELIEIIVLTPITIFILIYTILQVVSMTMSANVREMANNATRTFITERTFDSAILALGDYVSDTNNLSVSKIVITTKEVKNSSGVITQNQVSFSLNFSSDFTETTYFKNLYKKDDVTGEYSFNSKISESFQSNYEKMESCWSRENYIEIDYVYSISDIISNFTKISYYNASTKENVTLDYGVSGKIYATCKNIIIG